MSNQLNAGMRRSHADKQRSNLGAPVRGSCSSSITTSRIGQS